MKTVAIKGFISVRRCPVTEKDDFHFFNCKMDHHGYITVMPHSLQVEIPDDFNMAAAQVKCLNEQKEKLSKEFNARIAQINDEISKLLAISFDAESVSGSA